ncbi:FimV/HubP family polar landmark protein [Sutterella wadsworthensis]|uniref:FimV/HubP family polar landmark protein n=2 Tax=Sutterella wadsworthensis TaxID=40545 RepID=UPI001C035CC2|nr:FimV/HubP family polar landmark protein [Sutterella wadsworthensis]MBT9622216.1 fimbrial protein FimV [Sutterella wadsworthensis]
MFHQKLSMLAAAAAAALAVFPSLSQAVELGDLKVVSQPGQPLEAVLDVNDVDITISPLLVRVAPPATYLREGVEWPREAQDLKMARMGGEAGKVRVKVVGGQSLSEGFPLLIEMNAGGKVTVRSYRLDPVNGTFRVSAAEEMPAAEPKAAAGGESSAAPAAESAETAPQSMKAVDKSVEKVSETAEKPVEKTAFAAAEAHPNTTQRIEEKEKLVKSLEVGKKGGHRTGRYAPNVVREYVALNGFNPNDAFTVQRDMTLWSIAKLYWPSCPGALLEQVAVALTQKNPSAFVDGDPSRIVIGQSLSAPLSDEVFAIDPMEAFRAVHGASAAVPGPTQNLIDAQHRSREAAGETAAAQIAALSRGESTEQVAETGRKALDAWESDQKKAAAAGAPTAAVNAPAEAAPALHEAPESAAPVQTSAEASAEANPPAAAPVSEAETAAADTGAAAQPTAETDSKTEAAAPSPTESAPAEDAKPAQSAADAQQPAAEEKRPLISYLLIIVGIAIIASIAWRKRREKAVKEAEEAVAAAKKGQGVVAFQRDVAPAGEAQLKAVEATVDEAVKNGTTAGAMGVGAMAYTEAQMKADAQAAAAEAAAATAKKQVEEQPWLKADDNDQELPPLSDEERESSERTAKQTAGMTAEKLKRVDLNLDAQTPAYVPPLAPEPIPTEAAAAPVKAAPAPQPAAQPAAPVPNEKERARLEAIDAKLNLAKSFIGLDAKKEALELLAEVKKEGSEVQRAAAQRLLDEVNGKSAGAR